MQQLANSGFSADVVKAALHASNRRISFRYELLDYNENKKADLKNVLSAEISFNSLAVIKRTAKLKIHDDGNINFLRDRIKPYFRLYLKGKWLEWPLGIFILSSPSRSENEGKVYRDIEAYDGLQILKDDKFTTRYTITSGTNYYQAIISILQSSGITKYNIQQTTKALSSDKEYEPGTDKLTVINELLSDLAFDPLWVDEIGYYTSGEFQSPQVRASEYTYANDELSIMYNGLAETLDLFSVPNSWTVIASNAETEPLTSTYINNNASSPTSVISRGRTIVSYETIDSIADQASLDTYVKQRAFKDSQIYSNITFETALMPQHSYNDVFKINYSYMDINDKYNETSWIMPLIIGGRMKHEARKVVSI